MTTTNEINNENKTATVLTDDEIKAWLQEALQLELGNGFDWLITMVDVAAQCVYDIEEWDEENVSAAESKIREASTAAMNAQWGKARQLLQDAHADLGFVFDASSEYHVRSLEEQFDWCDSSLFAASLEKGSTDWAYWSPDPICLDSDPYYDGLWRVLEAWEDEGAKLALDGDMLVIAEEEECDEVFPEED